MLAIAAAVLSRRAGTSARPSLVAAVSLLLLGACIRQTDSMKCGARGSELQLDDAIHLSDVVVSGKIMSVTGANEGAREASIAFYYAYKRDPYLHRRAFSTLRTLAGFDPQEHLDGTGFFFLTREPSGMLAVQCVSTLSGLSAAASGSISTNPMTPIAMLDHVKEVATRKWGWLHAGNICYCCRLKCYNCASSTSLHQVPAQLQANYYYSIAHQCSNCATSIV